MENNYKCTVNGNEGRIVRVRKLPALLSCEVKRFLAKSWEVWVRRL